MRTTSIGVAINRVADNPAKSHRPGTGTKARLEAGRQGPPVRARRAAARPAGKVVSHSPGRQEAVAALAPHPVEAQEEQEVAELQAVALLAAALRVVELQVAELLAAEVREGELRAAARRKLRPRNPLSRHPARAQPALLKARAEEARAEALPRKAVLQRAALQKAVGGKAPNLRLLKAEQ